MPLDDDDGNAGPQRPPGPLDDVRKSLDDVGKSLEDVGKSLDDVRQLTDSQTLRALTHPVRIALIEALLLGGAMTATEVGERIGESATTCSFHLRQLAKYGFVEEAGGGKGRSRPWQLTATGMQFSSVHADPETEMAAVALVRMLRDRQFARYQTWLETNQNFPREWRDAAGSSESIIYLTPGELDQLSEEVLALVLPRFRERLTDPARRPPDAVPVEILMLAYPISLPPPGDVPPDETGSDDPAGGEPS
ncbi:MAG TPA: helix-turn-helix domain-containing protein [Streptosporangiaceae bacterium]|jgi:DNA-binding transcriptional ArsR family regulator|nr:helix-turn-helix domain-containing protein [Streptosporangiaceae bacterium]